MVEGCNKTDRRAGYCVTHGADKKCIVGECSKTGRIDNMCTKHYFERNQPFARSSSGATSGDQDTDIGDGGMASVPAKSRKKLTAGGAPVSSSMVRARMSSERKDEMPENTKRAKQGGNNNRAAAATTNLKNAVAAMDLSKSQQF